jgi:hypothetical protein
MVNYVEHQHPICSTEGCERKVNTSGRKSDGTFKYNSICRRCFDVKGAAKLNMSVRKYQNRKHEYRKHRLEYCENKDGRLGFKCSYKLPKALNEWEGWLDVDHIDGNPKNCEKWNLQTLCKCCHSYKTMISKDYLSPGRKTQNIKY